MFGLFQSDHPLAVTGIFLAGASVGAFGASILRRPSIRDGGTAGVLQPDRREAKSRCEMKALIVSEDREVIDIFSHLFCEKRIETHTCRSGPNAVGELSSEKFDTIILDFDNVPGCANLVECLCGPNKDALVIAVATELSVKQGLSDLGIASVVERPLAPSNVRALLLAAYGRMLRARQAYFRLAVELPVWIRRLSGSVVRCTTLNLSRNGMAVRTSAIFQAGESLNLMFAIPNTGFSVSAEGKVIWDDKHGKAGINFECADPSTQTRFYEWLHDQFFIVLELGSPHASPLEVTHV